MGLIVTLAKVKTRLGISDTLQDALLTQMITGVGALFDHLCDRKLERRVDHREEFPGDRTHFSVECYPVEQATGFEKTISGIWVTEVVAAPVLRKGCVVSVPSALADANEQVRITYTGGYVFPGGVVPGGAQALPEVLEAAALEMVTHWWQQKEQVGAMRVEGGTGVYLEFWERLGVPWVKRVLDGYRRMAMG